MSRPTAVHRVLVTTFAAWMLFCCCEKRLFAALVFPEAASGLSFCPTPGSGFTQDAVAEEASAPCCSGCCATPSARHADAASNAGSEREDEPGSDRGDVPQGRCCDGCCDGCCTRAPASATTFTLDRDEVGSEMPCFVVDCPQIADSRARSSACARSDGRPPPRWRTPRLHLVTTARLRI